MSTGVISSSCVNHHQLVNLFNIFLAIPCLLFYRVLRIVAQTQLVAHLLLACTFDSTMFHNMLYPSTTKHMHKLGRDPPIEQA